MSKDTISPLLSVEVKEMPNTMVTIIPPDKKIAVMIELKYFIL